MINKTLFSKYEINTGRQIEFDILKALAIIFMIFSHVFMCTDLSIDNSIVWTVQFIFGGSLAAPMFMFAMGLGWAYTKNNSYHDFIKRGCYLLILAFVLNFIRALGLCLDADPFEMSNIILTFLNWFLIGDILHFAGFAFILWGLFKKFNVNKKVVILIAIIFSILSTTILYQIPIDNLYLKHILGYFINTTYLDYSEDYPLLTWFIIPVLGYCFAYLLRRCKNKDKFYLRLMPITVICTFVFYFLDCLTGHGMYLPSTDYYHFSIFAALHCISIGITCLGIYNFLTPYLPKKIISFAILSSIHITEIYFFSWIFMGLTLLADLVGVETFSVLTASILAIIIIVISYLVAIYYRKSKIKKIVKIL